MPAGLTGLTGLAGLQVQIDTDSQATPEDRNGQPADPRHVLVGEQSPPYLYNSQSVAGRGGHGPYGPENQMLGNEQWFYQPAGVDTDDPDFDHTPSTRAAPFPKGNLSGPVPGDGPEFIGRQLEQSYRIHATDMNASARMQTTLADPLNDQWDGYAVTEPGNTDVQDVPRQMKSAGFGWGIRDVIQSFARQNGFGFDSAHRQRRYAVGSIPGNNYWMRPGGRLLAKSLPGPARPPIGPDSPFAGQDLGRPFAVGGAILLNQPSEYTAPPQVNLAQGPVYTTGDDAPVEFF